MEFNLGDVVRLKSGGPVMTVSAISARAKLGAQTVQCEWFNQVDQTYELKSASFPIHSLKIFQRSKTDENQSE